MAIGSVSVDIVPNARGFVEKLKAELRDVKVNVGVNLDSGKARAELDKLGATSRKVTINAEADTKLARAQLDRLAKTRTAKIRANVDKSSFRQAQSAASGAARGMGAMATAALALAPALIPATAAVVGLAGALAAPALAAGGGFGIFAAVTTAALVKAKKDSKAIQQLRKQADAATNPKKAAAYNKQADEALAKLPKAERAFVQSQGAISQAFNQLLKKSGNNVYGPLTHGSDLLAKVLPKLSPVVNAFGGAIDKMLGRLGHFADSKGFSSFVNFLATKGVSAFTSFAHIAGHVALGAGSIVKAFEPMGSSLLHRLDLASRGLDHIGQSRGFQSFLRYVRQVGPQVAHLIGDIAAAVVHIGRALAPQGLVLLRFADYLAKLVRNAKPGQLAAIAGGIGAIGLATGKIGKLAGLSLIITSLSYANKHSAVFHTLAAGAERLASALGKMPGGLNALIGLTAGAAVLSRRLPVSIGRPGGIVNKVLGGGVQKVFVVNMPGGGGPLIGPGGGPIPSKGAPILTTPGAHKAEETGLAALFKKYAGLALIAATKVAPYAFGSSSDTMPKGGNPGPMLNRLGTAVGAGQGAQFLDVANAVHKFDQNLVSLAKHHPAEALAKFRAAAQQAGLSVRQLSHYLPGAARALRDVAQQGGRAHGPLHSVSANLTALVQGAHHAGVSTRQLGRMLNTLPSQVVTKLLTPGAVKSKADVRALGRQFGLTPKQVHTLIKLLGFEDTKRKNRDIKTELKTLNGTISKPKIKPTDQSPPVVNKVNKNLHHIDATVAKPKIKATDLASGTINRVHSELIGLDGQVAHTSIVTTHLSVFQSQGSKNRSATAPGAATGGVFTGQRGIGVIRRIAEAGAEAVVPLNRALSQVDPSVRALSAIAQGKVYGMAAGGVVASNQGGPQILHFYDTDGVLLGTIRGVADNQISGRASFAATLARQ